jgi:glycosyltransferase involved in cell wall biosynthesis
VDLNFIYYGEIMKLLTVAIPCYNSAAYMTRAIESALKGGDDVEVIIVNDGSTDNTAEIADSYKKHYPANVKVIHKENGGHGSAVNAGIENAHGIYFKVLDSDDWFDESAYTAVLGKLKELMSEGNIIDMFLANYVYEKVEENERKVIRYRSAVPQNQIFTWNDVRHFKQGQYILMHSVIYRTKLIKECGMKLPLKTFYVDNIFVYEPLPYVKTIYYLDANLYRYFIGRNDQSVTEENMIKRVDQQVRVTRHMIDCHDLSKIHIKKLRSYMAAYLTMMMTISSVFLMKAGTEEKLKEKDELWNYLKSKDVILYNEIYHSFLGRPMNFKSRMGQGIVGFGYWLARKIFKFN